MQLYVCIWGCMEYRAHNLMVEWLTNPDSPHSQGIKRPSTRSWPRIGMGSRCAHDAELIVNHAALRDLATPPTYTSVLAALTSSQTTFFRTHSLTRRRAFSHRTH